jgi:hypothetical protein
MTHTKSWLSCCIWAAKHYATATNIKNSMGQSLDDKNFFQLLMSVNMYTAQNLASSTPRKDTIDAIYSKINL